MRIKKKSVLLGLFCREGAPYTIVDLCTFINLSCVLVYYAYLYVIVYYVAGMMWIDCKMEENRLVVYTCTSVVAVYINSS